MRDDGWRRSVEGEERTARRLSSLLDRRELIVLRDRRGPERRTSVDQITVGPGGVTVIDIKRWTGKVQVSHGRLMVGGRNRTDAIEGMRRQMRVIEHVLMSTGFSVPVRGAICLLNVDGLPLFRKLEIDGILVDGPRPVVKLARRRGELGADGIRIVSDTLDRAMRQMVAEDA